jgi:nitroreductase
VTLLSETIILDLVALASRAPSVHNVQPARWRFHEDRVTLFRALDRVLPVADPSGHDVEVSLGAAFEGMRLAMSQHNIAMNGVEAATDENAPGCAGVVRAGIRSDGSEDPLAQHVTHRRSFRHKFARVSERDSELIGQVEADDALIVRDPSSIRRVAAWHEAATWKFESNPEYHEELWSWLRLSRSDSRWNRDGLNADCLALSRPERIAARRLLAPLTFTQLSRLGVARRLVSEASQVRSAAALVVFAPLHQQSAFEAGRRFYRLWLELTALGYSAVPMSASADDAETNASITDLVGLPGDRRIANVFRVGRTGSSSAALSPRIPAHELLV